MAGLVEERRLLHTKHLTSRRAEAFLLLYLRWLEERWSGRVVEDWRQHGASLLADGSDEQIRDAVCRLLVAWALRSGGRADDPSGIVDATRWIEEHRGLFAPSRLETIGPWYRDNAERLREARERAGVPLRPE